MQLLGSQFSSNMIFTKSSEGMKLYYVSNIALMCLLILVFMFYPTPPLM